MSTHQIKYELLRQETNSRHRHTYIQVCLLVALCAMSSIAVFVTWTVIYRKHVNIPPNFNDIPPMWPKRAIRYAKYTHDESKPDYYSRIINSISRRNYTSTDSTNDEGSQIVVKQLDNERIYPSKYGNFIYKPNAVAKTKLVCYYLASDDTTSNLQPKDIHPHLCTHINVGMALIEQNRIVVDQALHAALEQITDLKKLNPELMILVWVGGADVPGFPEMIQNHANRKEFIQSLKTILETYHIDGIDLDWEFPSAYNRERQHFTQLVHEIRREYQREHRTYLLSVAAAAPESIAFFAYDIAELNDYVDYVNIMTYDYHFYTSYTPFTGLNAPLYQRPSERSYFATLNINTSINYWHVQGLDKDKIVIGLPTYGHSFKLIDPFNAGILSPAEGYGDAGDKGFVTYSDVCWFKQNNYFVSNIYDSDACSPYLHAGTEWISYENEQSIECKAQYIKQNGFGGAMIFSLNTDDYSDTCINRRQTTNNILGKSIESNSTFPLVRKLYSTLYGKTVVDKL